MVICKTTMYIPGKRRFGRSLCAVFGAGALIVLTITLFTAQSSVEQMKLKHLSSENVSSNAHKRVTTLAYAAHKSGAATQTLRRHALRQACSSLGFYGDSRYDQTIPQSAYSRNIHVTEKFQTAICLIPKCGSSSWVGTLLILEGFLNSTDGMSTSAIVQAAKKGLKSFSSYKEPRDKLSMLHNFTTALFVRNPFTRLLSAFRDRLEQYPNRNLFHRHMHNKNIYTMFGNHSADEMPDSSVKAELYNVTFKEFVDYYISGVTDVHWREQYKVCPPCIPYDYIGKVETFPEDFNEILTIIGAERNAPLIKAKHATHSSDDIVLKRYYSTLSDEAFSRLTDILQPDMRLFGYEIPDAIRRD